MEKDFIKIKGNCYPTQRIDSAEFDHLYFLLHDGNIVYVGKSVSPYGRITVHKNSNKIQFDSFCIIPISELGFDCISDAEAFFIAKHRPIYNSTLPKNTIYLPVSVIQSRLGLSGKISTKKLLHRLIDQIKDKVLMSDINMYFSNKEVEEKKELISQKHYTKFTNHD